MDRSKKACLCKGVTYGATIDAVNGGADSFEKVQAQTGCSTCCGKCREFIERFVAELARDRSIQAEGRK